MICFLYRWRLKPRREESFVEAWKVMTRALKDRGSLGARLHEGADGIWYSVAQWPSPEARTSAFAQQVEPDAAATMRECTLERFDEVMLYVVADELCALP